MKIGIFIDNFFTAQTYKDPGLFASSLQQLGHLVTIYCFNTNLKPGNFNIKKIKKHDSQSKKFWQEENIDYIIIYSWLSLRFGKLIKVTKSSGKKIILKLDSDGHLIFPLRPTYLRTIGKDNSIRSLLVHLARIIQWFILPKVISRKKIKHIALCDAAIIESPLALKNINDSLSFWGKPVLTKKIFFIPDPVHPDILVDSGDENIKKENIIICVGRWDDKQKNAKGLIETLKIINLNNWKILIIGNKAKKLKSKLYKYNNIKKIVAINNIQHESIKNYLTKGKIFFAPSNYESFNIAAAEALCCGCSIVGTPLESLKFFSGGDKFGRISSNFNSTNLYLALKEEMSLWDNEKRDPMLISKYWKEKLSPEVISIEIQSILKKI